MKMLLPFLAAALFLFSGCRTETAGVWPSGEPKALRTYSLWGPKDSLHLVRERTFYFNGKPERDARYRKGRLHGDYADFWQNGQKRSVGTFVDGKRQGPWEEWFNDYTVAAKGDYKDDRKHGPWMELYESGDLRAEGEYVEGREAGTWKRWSRKGDLTEESSCYPDNAEGRRKTFHAANTPLEDYGCVRGVPRGEYEKRSIEGEVVERGTWDSAGRKHGVWERFHANGKPAERRSWKEGVETDSLIAWDTAGRVRERGFFLEGSGEVTGYDSLGRLASRERRVKGAPEGPSWSYHPNGKPKGLVVYRQGKAEAYKSWHDNGRLAGEGVFEDGKRTGLWARYGSRGQTLEVAHYAAGKLHGERRLHDSAGNLMQVQRYERGYPATGRIVGGMESNFAKEKDST
jgi:antitoxin component YwqK of YwqJK toxin-antitoxin module